MPLWPSDWKQLYASQGRARSRYRASNPAASGEGRLYRVTRFARRQHYSSLLFIRVKSITDPDHGFDRASAFTKLFSKSTNVDVECSRVAEIAVAPDIVKQALA